MPAAVAARCAAVALCQRAEASDLGWDTRRTARLSLACSGRPLNIPGGEGRRQKTGQRREWGGGKEGGKRIVDGRRVEQEGRWRSQPDSTRHQDGKRESKCTGEGEKENEDGTGKRVGREGPERTWTPYT